MVDREIRRSPLTEGESRLRPCRRLSVTSRPSTPSADLGFTRFAVNRIVWPRDLASPRELTAVTAAVGHRDSLLPPSTGPSSTGALSPGHASIPGIHTFLWGGSVLDSGAVGPGFRSQPRRCQVTVLGELFTPILASVHQAAKLVAALLIVAKVTAGPAESNGRLLPGL